MRREERSVDFITAGRLQILEDLSEARGLTMPELPHRWPFTRAMLEDMVKELVLVGLVETMRSPRIPGQTAYALSRSGRAVLTSALAGRPAAMAG